MLARSGAWVPLLLLWAAIVFTYWQAPANGFHLDDDINIVAHTPLHVDQPSAAAFIEAARNGRIANRFLPNLSFALDWWRGGGEAGTFIRTNIALHALNATLVFLLIVRIMTLATRYPAASIRLVALVAAALWALHPIQVQAVTYIVQRMAELASLFTLLATLAYVQARTTAGLARLAWAATCLVALVGGALSKENAWIAPGLLLLAEYGVLRHATPVPTYRFDLPVLLLPPTILALIAIDLATGAGPVSDFVLPSYGGRDFTLAERLWTQPGVVLFHVSQVLWPAAERFSLLHDFPVSSGPLQPWTTLPAVLAVLGWTVIGMGLLFRRESRVIGFGMLWLPATLAVESTVIALEMVFEHRMYLPTFGMALLAALGLAWLLQRRTQAGRVAVGLALAATAATAVQTVQRIPVWLTKETLYADAVRKSPGQARSHYNYANALRLAGKPGAALEHYHQALALQGSSPEIHHNTGLALESTGQLQAAIDHYRRAFELDAGHRQSLWRVAMIEYGRGNPTAAEQQLRHALSPGPPNPAWLAAYARILVELDRQDDAERFLLGTLRRLGDDPLLLNELGRLLATQARYEAAEAAWTRAFRAAPGSADTANNLGGLMIATGRPGLARQWLRKALELQPGHPQALQNLAGLAKNEPTPGSVEAQAR